MNRIAATIARQRWAQTLDAARLEPVTITEHGRDAAVLLGVDIARRALQALEDAEDAEAAAAAQRAIAEGEPTVRLEDVARELGIELD